MTEKEKKYLSDIIQSIQLIESFTQELSLFSDYVIDLKTKSAVERQLAIIGEAVNKYLKESEENSLQHAEKIISLRNRLIHSYDRVDDSIIWSIIKRNLSSLKSESQAKIAHTD
jgi:uncharacterized protein with HEPN domain